MSTIPTTTEHHMNVSIEMHFSVPDNMSAVDAHGLMLQRLRGWLSSPENELRTSYGMFSPSSVPDVEPCIVTMTGTATTNLFPRDPAISGRGADNRTGLTQVQFDVWCDLSPSGSRSAPDVATRLDRDLETVQSALRGLETRGLAGRDASGCWWRKYL